MITFLSTICFCHTDDQSLILLSNLWKLKDYDGKWKNGGDVLRGKALYYGQLSEGLGHTQARDGLIGRHPFGGLDKPLQCGNVLSDFNP